MARAQPVAWKPFCVGSKSCQWPARQLRWWLPVIFVRCGGAGDGEVSLVMMLDLETEVEMKLPGRFKVSPQIAGAIKAVAGVVDVQQL